MPSTASASAEPVWDRLEVYRLRDDLVRSYGPANAHEFMLTTQIAQSWLRLLKAYEADERFFEKYDMLEIIGSDIGQFNAVTRHLSECERAWRHAVENLEKTQRRRLKTDLGSPRRHDNPNFRPAPAAAGSPSASPPQPSIQPDAEKFHQTVAVSQSECYIGSAATSEPSGETCEQTPPFVTGRGWGASDRVGSPEQFQAVPPKSPLCSLINTVSGCKRDPL